MKRKVWIPETTFFQQMLWLLSPCKVLVHRSYPYWLQFILTSVKVYIIEFFKTEFKLQIRIHIEYYLISKNIKLIQMVIRYFVIYTGINLIQNFEWILILASRQSTTVVGKYNQLFIKKYSKKFDQKSLICNKKSRIWKWFQTKGSDIWIL